MASGTRLTYSIFAAPITADKDDLIALLMPSWTSANFASATHEINTDDKFAGKIAWDTTLSQPRVASGPAVADSWDLLSDAFAGPPSATTAELAAIADPINTDNKRAGKIVWNSTASILVVAVGATAGSVWNGVHDNLLDHTPV